MAAVGAVALGFATMALSSALGGNTKIQMSDDNDEEY